ALTVEAAMLCVVMRRERGGIQRGKSGRNAGAAQHDGPAVRQCARHVAYGDQQLRKDGDGGAAAHRGTQHTFGLANYRFHDGSSIARRAAAGAVEDATTCTYASMRQRTCTPTSIRWRQGSGPQPATTPLTTLSGGTTAFPMYAHPPCNSGAAGSVIALAQTGAQAAVSAPPCPRTTYEDQIASNFQVRPSNVRAEYNFAIQNDAFSYYIVGYSISSERGALADHMNAWNNTVHN